MLGFVAHDQTNISADSLGVPLTSRLGKCSAQLLSISVSSIGFIASPIIPERDYRQSLETRAVTFYVFRISEHTRITHVLFVLASVLFPLCHVIKASGKLFTSNPLNDLFAAVTENFNRCGLIPRSLLRYSGSYEPIYP